MTHRSESALRLDGALTLRGCAELARSLLAALNENASLSIDASSVRAADVCALQVLVAAHRSARDRGRSLRIRIPAGTGLDVALDRSGLRTPADASLVWDGEHWTGLDESERTTHE